MARLRWAGFDGLIFSGKSEKPVYAYVTQDKVELLDASELWGKGVHETVKFFQDQYGDKELSVIAIGQDGKSFPDSPTGSTKMTGPLDAENPAACAAAKA